ncbi:signal peptidase I [Paludibacterium yongneupense]|uniref:signal peptidase I n=1 Tax=Paludibacterium yongneupense TaxID=400061 RepID=UPI000409849C|nr:signal peptidase I [Paludibacterium yongneupense]
MGGNLFWVFVAMAVVGILLVARGGKKEVGAKDYPAAVQWGALVLVIGIFGVLSEYMSFTAVMLLFVVATGAVAACDRFLLAPRRAAVAGVEASTGEDVARSAEGKYASAEPGVLVEYSRGFFPVILVVFLLRSFLVEPFTIPSSSMRPGLVVGDFILVNKFTYGLRVPVLNTVAIPVGKVARGDVVVFNFPPNPKVNYIKRVIGLPGDVVEYRNKRLTINGVAASYAADGSYDFVEQQLAMIHTDKLSETQHGKKVSVLNIPDSPTLTLSQVMDFPDRDKCLYDDSGFKCTVPAGHYFMMGDNRDDSLDSRYWGFVDDKLIVGRAFMIWMNFKDLSRIGHVVN